MVVRVVARVASRIVRVRMWVVRGCECRWCEGANVGGVEGLQSRGRTSFMLKVYGFICTYFVWA